MKKVIALCCCFLLLLCGCRDKTANVESEGFSCNAVARFGDNTYRLFLQIPGGGIIKAEVTEGEMKGLTLTLDGEDVSVRFLGMEYKLPDGFFGENCLTAIKEVLETLKRDGQEVKVDSNRDITLDTDFGLAKITVRPDGFPTKIVLFDEDAEITFSDFNYIS